jgi:hypothetical protein
MARDARSGSYPITTPTLTAGSYLRGYQVGGIQELPRHNHRAGVILQSLTVVDTARFKAGIDVYMFDTLPVLVSVDRQPFAIADAQMAFCAGVVSLLNSDYASNDGSSVATLANIGLGIKVTSPIVYAVAVARNSFTVAGDLQPITFRYHLELERV